MVRVIKTHIFAFLVLLLLFSVSYAKPHAIYQYSPLNSLMSGVYDGGKTIAELYKYGNFGMGTINGLDGELVIVKGQAYQIRSDGQVVKLNGNTNVPFAQVCFFTPQKSFVISGGVTLETAKTLIDSKLKSKNIFYAINIKGQFEYVKARSVPKQFKPFVPCLEVVKKQSVFELVTTEGQVIGFRCPEYIKEINSPGYHFHYLNNDMRSGGHVLNLRIVSAEVSIDAINEYDVEFPQDNIFLQQDLSGTLQYKP